MTTGPSRRQIRLYRIVLLILVVIFVVYNIRIYRIRNANLDDAPMTATAAAGQKLWQKNNCAACHQLYGLGGYLGPDLTNVMSLENKGIDYIKVMLNSGIKSMPKFEFTEKEQDELVAYLAHVDSTGYYPNHDAHITSEGWVKLKYKQLRRERNH